MINPYAFPFIEHEFSGESVTPGMTLRDYLAAKAMHGMVKLQSLDSIELHQRAVASQAYKMADAMLKARE